RGNTPSEKQKRRSPRPSHGNGLAAANRLAVADQNTRHKGAKACRQACPSYTSASGTSSISVWLRRKSQVCQSREKLHSANAAFCGHLPEGEDHALPRFFCSFSV